MKICVTFLSITICHYYPSESPLFLVDVFMHCITFALEYLNYIFQGIWKALWDFCVNCYKSLNSCWWCSEKGITLTLSLRRSDAVYKNLMRNLTVLLVNQCKANKWWTPPFLRQGRGWTRSFVPAGLFPEVSFTFWENIISVRLGWLELPLRLAGNEKAEEGWVTDIVLENIIPIEGWTGRER